MILYHTALIIRGVTQDKKCSWLLYNVRSMNLSIAFSCSPTGSMSKIMWQFM